jgi:hypothetical protein
MTTERTEIDTYTIDDVIRVPVVLEDHEGVAHVRVIFRRMRRSGGLGPRGLDPEATLELRGNGQNQKEVTVEATHKVADRHRIGEYLCVAIQVYDSHGNMVMIENPKPSRLLRIVDEGTREEDRKTQFLGWGDQTS